MANLYTFISAEEITVFIPPNSSEHMMQVTAQAIQSQIGYVAQFPKATYTGPGAVSPFLDALANGFNVYANVPGVDGIAAIQSIDSSNQLRDEIDVTVISTSGRSTSNFRTGYPSADFLNLTLEHFTGLVDAERATLDAVEAG